MSSKILTGPEQPVAAPVSWRTVNGESRGALASYAGRGRGSGRDRESGGQAEQVRQEAFAEGVRAGRSQAEEQVLPAIEGVARTLAELAAMRQGIRAETLEDLVRLSVQVAARVIHREVAVDPDALAGLVQAAFLKLQAREIHRVRMHPGLESLVSRCLEKCGSPRNLVLVPDPALTPGELFFETSQGALDASVDTQLREIERGLIDKLEQC